MQNYAKRLIKILKNELDASRDDRSKITYTGAAKRSLKTKTIKSTLQSLNMEIVGKSYIMDIEKGRKPKGLQVNDIAKWLVKKPVAYANKSPNLPQVQKIAKSVVKTIKRKGVRRLPFIEDAVKKDMKNLKVLAPILKDVELSINDILKEEGFDMNNKTVKFV